MKGNKSLSYLFNNQQQVKQTEKQPAPSQEPVQKPVQTQPKAEQPVQKPRASSLHNKSLYKLRSHLKQHLLLLL